VVVDYLWGNSASALLAALAKHTPGVSPVRFVQVGALSEGEITLPGAVLRSSPIQLMGCGIGSLSMADLLQATAEMLQAAVRVALPLPQHLRGWKMSPTPGRATTVDREPCL
jgi:hypothetical protein